MSLFSYFLSTTYDTELLWLCNLFLYDSLPTLRSHHSIYYDAVISVAALLFAVIPPDTHASQVLQVPHCSENSRLTALG
jgi:hypothetical protein